MAEKLLADLLLICRRQLLNLSNCLFERSDHELFYHDTICKTTPRP
jgi:hypothetical protein